MQQGKAVSPMKKKKTEEPPVRKSFVILVFNCFCHQRSPLFF